MSRPWKRLAAAISGRPAATLQSVTVLFCLVLIFSTNVAPAQGTPTGPPSVRSVSGQFSVSAVPGLSPLLHRADLAADTNLVRLEPALLAISAERFKFALWSRLGIRLGSPWSGKIFFAITPAQTPNDEVNIEIIPSPEGWSYRVQLPDIVTQTRYARALTGVLLLELANRGNHDATHSAELPPWLTDGLARQILGSEAAKIVLSSPSKKTDGTFVSLAEPLKKTGGLSLSRVDDKQRGFDPLADSRRTLQDFPALTYDDLCWPTGAQMNGNDGGAYLASAQLFVDSLLGLENGPEKMCALLQQLPGCQNWQTAFYSAFHQQFKRPLDVEKWWSLRVIRFASREPGPRWNNAASRERFADLLAVPVEYREAPDALPEHTVVSLQNAIRNFRSAQLDAILEIKRRDFELAQFRMVRPFAVLADGYRATLTDFLGDGRKNPRRVTTGKNVATTREGLGVEKTVARLDALDARRRDLEAKLDAAEAIQKPAEQQVPAGQLDTH
ncbi:MAG TPA: hypothetical protein VG347_11935 [Verrucomicrobiae bacterium]|nr:hypothetical protein [Verrucomicrobiae bacterium]